MIQEEVAKAMNIKIKEPYIFPLQNLVGGDA